MALHDQATLIIETKDATPSLPDPALATSPFTKWLVNDSNATQVWTSSGSATPFEEPIGVPVATISVAPGQHKEVRTNGVRWLVQSVSDSGGSADSGFAVLPGPVVLPAPGGYINSGLSVNLPRAGTYHLDANVRTSISGLVAIDVSVSARLFNVTGAAVVPNSEIIANKLFLTGVAVLTFGNDNTAGIHVEVSVPAAATIRLELDRTDTLGILTTSSIESDASGRTTLRYNRVHD